LASREKELLSFTLRQKAQNSQYVATPGRNAAGMHIWVGQTFLEGNCLRQRCKKAQNWYHEKKKKKNTPFVKKKEGGEENERKTSGGMERPFNGFAL